MDLVTVCHFPSKVWILMTRKAVRDKLEIDDEAPETNK